MPGIVNDGNPRWEQFRAWIMPSYDAVSLFLIAVTFILLFVLPTGFREDFLRITFWKTPFSYSFALVCAGGLWFCLFHAFSWRKKADWEKTLMALFAMGTNAAVGIRCGFDLLQGQIGLSAVFPVVNILAGLLLIYELGLFGEDAISENNVQPVDLAIGLIPLLLVFAYCQVFLRLNWPMTFSVCIAYSSFAHHLLHGLLKRFWNVFGD